MSFINGDIDLKGGIILTSPSGKTYNMQKQVRFVDIYESIMKPYVYAEFQVHDSIDILRKFPILSEETITISFATDGDATVADYEFVIADVKNIHTDTENRSTFYTIKAVSKEQLMNTKNILSKRFKSKEAECIQTVLNEELDYTGKLVAPDDTKGTFDYMVNKLHPFQIIDLIRRRSVSKLYQSSSYLFFRDRDKFNFLSVEKMTEDRKALIGNKVYTYNATSFTDIEKDRANIVNYKNILAYQNLSVSNPLKKTYEGAEHSVTTTFDLFTGKIERTEYKSNFEDFNNTDDVGVDHNTSQFKEELAKKPTKRFYLAKDTTRKEQQWTEEKIGKVSTFANMLENNKTIIEIWGDSNIMVGDVITIKLPEFSGGTGDTEESKLIAGNYVISNLRHNITVNGVNGPEHKMSLELIKSNLTENV